MTLSLELPKDLESELKSEAKQFGLTDYTLQLLRSRPQPKTKPYDGAELIQYWKNAGLIGSRTDVEDSQTHARKLRHQAERHYSKGH